MARKKKRGSQTKPRSEFGIAGLLVALVILSAIGYALADATEYAYRWFGFFWWGTAVFVAFLLGLLYYALFILPIPGVEGWAEGLHLLVRNYLSAPQRLAAPDASARSTPSADTPPELAELPPSFVSLKSGVARSHQVLALVRGATFARPAGPGFVVLYKGEGVGQIIDLRRHTRAQRVKANTRDGIPVELDVFVTFRIWQEESEIRPDQPIYHYNREAIFQVNYAGNVGAGDRFRAWSELVAPQAAALLVAEIAQYALEQLYQTDDSGFGPLTEIRQRLKRNLEQSDLLTGIDILGVGTGMLILPPAVYEQRLKQWRMQWEQEIKVRLATGDAEAERRLKRARARAQIEIIENITQNITTMRRTDGISLSEVVTLRMIGALEDAVTDASVKALVPPPVLSGMVDNSRELLTWIEEQEEPPQ
jgi:regulator of protease activity HflC (stomatin/prohibitin superfamily)